MRGGGGRDGERHRETLSKQPYHHLPRPDALSKVLQGARRALQGARPVLQPLLGRLRGTPSKVHNKGPLSLLLACPFRRAPGQEWAPTRLFLAKRTRA